MLAYPEWITPNLGNSPRFLPFDIGHPSHLALVQPDTAFWLLVEKSKLADLLASPELSRIFKEKGGEFTQEMATLRFGLTPSAVYFNPTERCNFNCTYCYIPDEMRKNGPHMSEPQLLDALRRLREYFKRTIPDNRKPQIVFHGSEPLLNRQAMFSGIEQFSSDFRFGIQTNATLLDDSAIEFIKTHKVAVGISIDGADAASADQNRRDWEGKGYFSQIVKILDKLSGHPGFSVICTLSKDNINQLIPVANLFHQAKVETCMFNITRCTRPGARTVRPEDDLQTAQRYIELLDHTHTLYKQSGHKMVVANFANILLAILAPSARRLMCDISPCGGGRCFFALAADGGLFPCSEFVGLNEFQGGNLFDSDDAINQALISQPFLNVSTRKTETIPHCASCAIQHFCGSPCPAEAHAMNGDMTQPGAFCTFYQEQVKYAFRLIADGIHEDFLPDDWDSNSQDLIDDREFSF